MRKNQVDTGCPGIGGVVQSLAADVVEVLRHATPRTLRRCSPGVTPAAWNLVGFSGVSSENTMCDPYLLNGTLAISKEN